MTRSKAIQEAEKIQGIAERKHCASAILAVQDLLKQDIRARHEASVKEMQDKFSHVYNREDMAKLKWEKQKLDEKIQDEIRNVEIHFVYEAFAVRYYGKPVNSARRVEHKTKRKMTIVLPLEVQSAIDEPIKESICCDWSCDMKDAKEFLRNKTAHELYHILHEDPLEAEAVAFANHLTGLRIDRSKRMGF